MMTSDTAIPGSLAQVQPILHQCTQGSLQGTMGFPEVVQRLWEIGVESYRVDLYRHEKTYYFPDGLTLVAPMEFPSFAIGQEFRASGIQQALTDVQNQRLSYLAFLQEIATAGCTHYQVYLSGRQTVYYGRSGCAYTEPMPEWMFVS